MPLLIRTETLEDVRVLRCAGGIAYGRDIEVLTELITEILQQKGAVLLDLEEVTAIDSAGVGALVVLYRWAQAGNAKIAFCCPPRRLSKLLHILHLRELLQIYEGRQQAVLSLLATELPRQSSCPRPQRRA